MLAYLAGPIDDVTGLEATSWRAILSDLLKNRGIASFHPNLAYRLPSSADKDIRESILHANRHMIIASQLVIAYLDGKGRAIGTMREVEFARASAQRQVIIIGTNLDMHFALTDCEIVTTLEDAAEKAAMIKTRLKHVQAEFSTAAGDG